MLLYNSGVLLYYTAIRIAALFNHKARLWVNGRRQIFEHIQATIQQKIKSGDRVIWIHCASLGEFEQGRPVLEKLYAEGYKIVLTFFSPSGYEIRKDYQHADAVFYLPIDLRANAERFIEIIKPHAALFVKYEFWLNYLSVLKEKKIDTYLISGVFRPQQHFFKWYGRNFFRAIAGFRTLFVQDEESLGLLKQHGLNNAVLAGDTRFDRVMEIASVLHAYPEIAAFCGDKKIIVAGSTWPRDEELVLDCYRKLNTSNAYKLILVPHEVDDASMQGTVERLRAASLASGRYSQGNFREADILVIDTIGLLSRIYKYATVAYVGGGFNDGIHNILEVMAYKVPVGFGPNYHKFVEAREAEAKQIGRPVKTSEDLYLFLESMLTNDAERNRISVEIGSYMQGKTGATEKVCAAIR